MTRWFICATCLVMMSCGKDFDPRTLIQDYRVIGVVAEPPEIRGPGQFSLTVADTGTTPESDVPIVYQWSICAFSLGPFADFECYDPAINFELSQDTQRVEVDLSAAGLDLFRVVLDWVSTMEDQLPIPAANCSDSECDNAAEQSELQSVELQVTVISGPQGGKKVTTIKRLNVIFDDTDLDTNPVIESLVIGDGEDDFTAAPGESVTLKLNVDRSSFQTYTDARGKVLEEIPLVTWYTSAGTLTPPITDGENLETTLKLPAEVETRPVRVFAALRDQRRGFTYAEGVIEIR